MKDFEVTNREKVIIGASLVVLLGACNAEQNPAGKVDITGPGCDDLAKTLYEGEQNIRIPTNCRGEVELFKNVHCEATFTPILQSREKFDAKTENWNLNIDPIIEGSDVGKTTIKCTFENNHIPSEPTILPTPTLDPAAETSSDSSIKVSMIPIDNPPDYFQELVDTIQMSFDNNSQAINGVLPKGAKAIMQDGLVVGFSMTDDKGETVHIISATDPKISPLKKDWYFVQTSYKENRSNKLRDKVLSNKMPEAAKKKTWGKMKGTKPPKGVPQVV